MASKPKCKKLEEVSVDEFFSGNFDSLDDDDSDHRCKKRKGKAIPKKMESANREASIKSKEPTNSTELMPKNKKRNVKEGLQHKKSLRALKDTDPEFYKYLEENDEDLLNFDVSESEDDDEDDGAQGVHLPPQSLEVASDDSAAEEEGENIAIKKTKNGKIIVSMSLINKWTELLQAKEPTLGTLQDVILAFRAAVEQVQDADEESDCLYKVNSGAVFNAVMRMCIVHLPSTLNCLLKLPKKKDDEIVYVSSAKRWPKIQSLVKGYLSDLLKVLLVMAEPSIVAVLLKHTYQMVPYITATSRFAKSFLKKLVQFWATGEETVRILAFMGIIKILRILPEQFHEFVLKAMYMAFVKNSKFTSPSTWPTINFMKHSLVEVFALDENQAYQYAFVYIRQLSIHLRNAMTVKKKDNIAAVYNWQYIHCLNFWSLLLSSLHNIDILRPLIHPLVHIIIGTIRLVSTAKYYPLRFQCVSALTLLSKETGTFIPVMPIITEVFEMTDFNKKHTKQSWKPLDFSCMLKLSKVQLSEHGFKDGLLDQIYEHMISNLTIMAHKISFPELVLPTTIKFKAFLKKCKVANYSKQVKQLLDKLEENSKFITEQRKNVTFHLSDAKAINAWETQIKLKGTPLSRYYESYKKLRERELLHAITKKTQLEASDDVQEVRRRELMEKHKAKAKEDVTQLFGGDLDDDSSDADLFSKKAKTCEREGGDLNKNSQSEVEMEDANDDSELTDLPSITSSSDSEG